MKHQWQLKRKKSFKMNTRKETLNRKGATPSIYRDKGIPRFYYVQQFVDELYRVDLRFDYQERNKYQLALIKVNGRKTTLEDFARAIDRTVNTPKNLRELFEIFSLPSTTENMKKEQKAFATLEEEIFLF
jgi:hypothetical protein